MIAVISPAKSLDFETPYHGVHTLPRLLDNTKEMVAAMTIKSADELANMMGISEQLAALNVDRFHHFDINHTLYNSKPCAFAFQGDVYQGLSINDFDEEDLNYCQKHLRILSGLYGLLRPMDLIQPYRLEMGTKPINRDIKTLYEFWGDRIAQLLSKDLIAQGDNVLINLASVEYFKSIKLKTSESKIINVDFKDFKNGDYKIISFYAKKARGMMSRYLVKKRINCIDGIKSFDLGGYEYDNIESTTNKFVFKRNKKDV